MKRLVSITLLTGKEVFLKQEFIHALRQRLFLNGAESKINFEAFHGSEEPLGGFLEFIRTAPFLGDKRLAVLWGIDALDEEEKNSLPSILSALPATAVVVLSTEESNAKKNDFLRQLAGVAETVACHPPFEKDLPVWVESRARKQGLRVNRQAVEVLIERAGKGLSGLSRALETLAVYVHPGTLVTAKEVETLLGRSTQADVFDVVDALLKKDLHAALEKITALSREGVRSYEMVAVLAGQLERLKKASGLIEEGHAPAQIAAELNVRPFFLEKFMRQARRTSKKEIQRALNLLLACDESIKRGISSGEAALDSLLLAFCSGKEAELKLSVS